MLNLKHLFSCMGVLLLGAVHCTLCSAAPAASGQAPLSVQMPWQPSSKVSADEFRKKFGLDDDNLSIEKIEVDTTAAASDGPVVYNIKAKVLKPNSYIFTFEHMVFDLGYVFETRKVMLSAGEKRSVGDGPPKIIYVSPDDTFWETYSFGGRVRADGSSPIIISWSWNPGGEGPINGWFLSKIEDMASMAKKARSYQTSRPCFASAREIKTLVKQTIGKGGNIKQQLEKSGFILYPLRDSPDLLMTYENPPNCHGELKPQQWFLRVKQEVIGAKKPTNGQLEKGIEVT